MPKLVIIIPTFLVIFILLLTFMTMTNDVLEQLNYLKLKSAYSYLNSLVMNNEIAEEELHVMHKILNKEVIAKEENNRLYNVKVAAFPFLRKVDDYDFNFQPGYKRRKNKIHY